MIAPDPQLSAHSRGDAHHRSPAGARQVPSPSVPSVVDLFAGAGGLSLGFSSAGFEVVAAAEWDNDACDTFSKHHPAASVIRGDLGDEGNLKTLREYIDVDLVVGGPPCQPWSTGGLRLGHEDARDGFPLFRDVIRMLSPRAFVMENVAGVLRSERRKDYNTLLRQLRALGYSVAVAELNAADFGVPQRRRRVFAVGVRDRITFRFPEGSYGPGRSASWRAAGEFIDPNRILGTPNPSKVVYAANPDTRPSPYDGHVFNGGGRPIDLTKPAPTLLASMGGNKTPWIDTLGVVPEYHRHLMQGGQPRSGEVPGARRLTITEAALLQTFPVPEVDGEEGVQFSGRQSSQYRQIGNAVPPLLGYAVAAALMDQVWPDRKP